jgi:hypothetical protein
MEPHASIVLNVMGLRELAAYGFRSWMIQDYDQPYEVVLNLFNDARPMFEKLREGANPNCRVAINEVEPPEMFNISAANNLGLHDSTGKYVIFANSDIIHPAHFLSRAMGEIEARNICYAVASRMNLSEQQNKLLRSDPASYTREKGFTEIQGTEKAIEALVWRAFSPWIVRRDIAFAIGGFDMRILAGEDKDLNDRVMHYLRRQGLQQVLFGLTDLFGYHQWHPTTGLMDVITDARAIYIPRDQRLSADPDSTEDIVDSPLNDRQAILDVIRKTKKPATGHALRVDYRGKLSRRARKVWDAIVYGR